jgi:threonylcarbamoyladenosine tRNA methylthiotransferase MtaB
MEDRTRVAIATLGCKVNFADTQLIEEGLDPARFRRVSFEEEAEIYVVNTCTVTANADAQARNLIRRAKRRNPGARVVVTGCYASMRPEELRRLPEVDRVFTLGERGSISAVLRETARARPALPVLAEAPEVLPRHRPVVKIQEGCDVHCSFCVIPTSRGDKPWSMPVAEVLARLTALDVQGAREVVLTGPYIGGYGRDLQPPTSLARLCAAIAERGFGFRVRISSIQPTELTDELLETVAGNAGICRHLHIPLQAGDDAVLRRMNRPYGGEEYARLLERIAGRISGIGLGADVIVGHPGEDESAFERTLALTRRLPLSYLHVFPFSARPGTPAQKMRDAPRPEVAKERALALREVDGEKRAAFVRSQVGKRLGVLLETRSAERADHWRGYSDNYLLVLVPAHAGRDGDLVSAEIVEARARDAVGAPVAWEPEC